MEQSVAKKTIRSEIARLRMALSETERSRCSALIASFVCNLDEFKSANSIMVYAAKDNEVDTADIIRTAYRDRKGVLFPKYNTDTGGLDARRVSDTKKDLEIGAFGVLEPCTGKTESVPAENIDLVLVPCVAVDRNGFRVGRGGGCYDRFLGAGTGAGRSIGIVYDFQYVTAFDVQEHDVPVDMIISEKGVHVCEGKLMSEGASRGSDNYKREEV